MLVNASYHDHQEYIWFMGGILTIFKIISKLYNKGEYIWFMSGNLDHFQDNH